MPEMTVPVKSDGRRAADGGDVHGFAHGVFVVGCAPALPVFRPELHGKEHFIPLEGDPAGPGMEARGRVWSVLPPLL